MREKMAGRLPNKPPGQAGAIVNDYTGPLGAMLRENAGLSERFEDIG